MSNNDEIIAFIKIIGSINFNEEYKVLSKSLVPFCTNEEIINSLKDFLNGRGFLHSKDYHPLRKTISKVTSSTPPLLPKKDLANLGTLLTCVSKYDPDAASHYKKILASDPSGYENILFELEVGCYIKSKEISMKFCDIGEKQKPSTYDFMIPFDGDTKIWIDVTTSKEIKYQSEFLEKGPHDEEKYYQLLNEYLARDFQKMVDKSESKPKIKNNEFGMIIFRAGEVFPWGGGEIEGLEKNHIFVVFRSKSGLKNIYYGDEAEENIKHFVNIGLWTNSYRR